MPSAGETPATSQELLDAWLGRMMECRLRASQILVAEYTNLARAVSDKDVVAQKLEMEIKKLDDLTEAEARILSDIGRSAWTDRIRSEEWLGMTGRTGARIKRRIASFAGEMNAAEGRIRDTTNQITAIRRIIVDIGALLNIE